MIVDHHGQSQVERIDRRIAWDETSSGRHPEPNKPSDDAECQPVMSYHMSIGELNMRLDQNVYQNLHQSIAWMGRL